MINLGFRKKIDALTTDLKKYVIINYTFFLQSIYVKINFINMNKNNNLHPQMKKILTASLYFTV